jgi:cation:H+ antiporter
MVLFLLGLVALIVGAELLARGASRLALSLGITPLVVGLTVVAFGTSAPELAVSVQSAWAGQVDIALGNVVGSNMFNVLVILGLSALITPLVVHHQVIRQEVPVLIGASLLLWALALDGGISRWEGVLLTALVVGYTVLLLRQSRRETAAVMADVEAEYEEAFDGPPKGWDAHWGVQTLLILTGLALLVLGAHWLVEASVGFARTLGVSELVIGLTVVAVGTSLPEAATSVMAALRGERDIAVGNAIGSSIFNILAVLGISASLAPAELLVAPSMLAFDIPVVVAVAIACLPVFFIGNRIARWDGILFLSLYAAYILYLIFQASGHDALYGYSQVMGGFVLPLMAAILLMLVWRHWHGKRRKQGVG